MKIAKHVIMILILVTFKGNAQEPVQWSFDTRTKNGEVILQVKAVIEPGWKLYAPSASNDVPVTPLSISINPSDDFKILGDWQEQTTPVLAFDPFFGMEISWYESTARLSRKMKLRYPRATITGEVVYMACNDRMCLPPRTETFTLNMGKANLRKEKN